MIFSQSLPSLCATPFHRDPPFSLGFFFLFFLFSLFLLQFYYRLLSDQFLVAACSCFVVMTLMALLWHDPLRFCILYYVFSMSIYFFDLYIFDAGVWWVLKSLVLLLLLVAYFFLPWFVGRYIKLQSLELFLLLLSYKFVLNVLTLTKPTQQKCK